MARLVLPIIDVVSGYPVTPVAANALDFVFTAAGASFADGAGFAHTGREVLLVKGGAGASTVEVSSVNDGQNRKGDITAYALGIGEYMAIALPVPGWRQTDNQLYVEASAADVGFAVLRLPALI